MFCSCNVNHRTPTATPDYLHMVALRGNSSLATLLLLAGFKLWRADWLSGIFTPGTLMSRLATVRYFLWFIILFSSRKITRNQTEQETRKVLYMSGKEC